MAGKHSKNKLGSNGLCVEEILGTEHRNMLPVSLTLKITIAVIVLSLAASAIFAAAYFLPGKLNDNILKKAASTFESISDYNAALKTLAADNGDIKGWLKISDTPINFAVCQSDNNSYYINHNQLGKKSSYGAVFLSSSDSFERSGNDHNIVIYGNNMENGSMFGSLKKYRSLNFYKQNPTVDLYYPNNHETYTVFAVMLISSAKDDAVSDYNAAKGHFKNETDFNKWYEETKNRSIINTSVQLEYGDDMLTMVTTASDFDGARLAVIAKKTDPKTESQTNTDSATVNKNIKYPEIWYKERGQKYPY